MPEISNNELNDESINVHFAIEYSIFLAFDIPSPLPSAQPAP